MRLIAAIAASIAAVLAVTAGHVVAVLAVTVTASGVHSLYLDLRF